MADKDSKRICRLANDITEWLANYLDSSGLRSFVVGVSGGIDSAVVANLCARTRRPLKLVSLPYGTESKRTKDFTSSLYCRFSNVTVAPDISIRPIYDSIALTYQVASGERVEGLEKANILSRIRMVMLYAFANKNEGLVVGTGNKVEDFGIGFFTKYGDGGVDISPIADLYKSEVYELGRELGVPVPIMVVSPTDDLWDDGRTDEDQIGATYPELENAMKMLEIGGDNKLTQRQKVVMKIVLDRKAKNFHKMCTPPIYEVER